ncbi:MAG: helix-turn-helix domain-containing protein [Agathobacter sp.]|nr:helix-turn-helix domain-containing protein [Agathobacter sp.]
MEKLRYMISDASNMVQVEAHVLRYWEEELGLAIPRNEMGHRYYTKENIKEFQRIKELKDQGYQLRAIKNLLATGETALERASNPQSMVANEEKMEQFREIMSHIVGQAISLNNEELLELIGREVEERVLKEMNYLVREQDAAEEERFKKLDAAIRGQIKHKKIFFPKKKMTSKKECPI